MQQEFKVEGYEYVFRTANMNAVEILSFRTQINYDTFDNAMNMINTVLEHLEVQVDNSWLPVKVKNKKIYYPAEAETNVDLIEKLCNYFTNEFILPVFMKSDE